MPVVLPTENTRDALADMSRVLASELSPRGIRVSVVIPGATSTPIWSRLAPPPEALAQVERSVISRLPLERFGTASEVGKAVLFFASDDAVPIQAAEIVVDGGMTGAPPGAPRHRKETDMDKATIDTNAASKLRTSMHVIVFQRLASRQLEKEKRAEWSRRT